LGPALTYCAKTEQEGWAVAAVAPPFPWLGGKARAAARLVSLLPPHRIYVEVFGGSAAVLLAKPPSPVEVYNDIDSGLVNFFRVLRDPERFERFRRLVELTPYSREEWEFCRATWESCSDDVERAWRWYVVARMSFGGVFGASWGHTLLSSSRGMAEAVSRWLSGVEGLPEVAVRLLRVQVENRDFRELFPLYDTPDTLWFCDPPYVPETRRDGEYRHEMALADHEDLVRLLLGIRGSAVLCGYRHEVYRPLEEAGWVRYDWPAVCSVVGRTRLTGLLGDGSASAAQPRVESVWVGPPGRAAQLVWPELLAPVEEYASSA